MDINRINVVTPVSQTDYKAVQAKSDIKDFNKSDDNTKMKNQTGSKNLQGAVELLNKALFKNNTHLKFQIHDKTKQVMVEIVSDETGEVLKEIPPKKILDIAADLMEIAGIIIDERR